MTDQPDQAAHLIPTHSDRGFARLPEITCAYGATVAVYESSSAEGAHVWLSVESFRDDGCRAAAHLTVADARRLSDQLAWLATHHYQEEDQEAGEQS